MSERENKSATIYNALSVCLSWNIWERFVRLLRAFRWLPWCPAPSVKTYLLTIRWTNTCHRFTERWAIDTMLTGAWRTGRTRCTPCCMNSTCCSSCSSSRSRSWPLPMSASATNSGSWAACALPSPPEGERQDGRMSEWIREKIRRRMLSSNTRHPTTNRLTDGSTYKLFIF